MGRQGSLRPAPKPGMLLLGGLRGLGKWPLRRHVRFGPALAHHPVERSVPATVQRAAKSFCSPLLGSPQVTARVRISRVSAPRAAAPHGQGLPSLRLQVASASRAAMPPSLMTTPPDSSVPPSRTVTR